MHGWGMLLSAIDTTHILPSRVRSESTPVTDSVHSVTALLAWASRLHHHISWMLSGVGWTSKQMVVCAGWHMVRSTHLMCLTHRMCDISQFAQITKLEVEAAPGLSCSRAENVLSLL